MFRASIAVACIALELALVHAFAPTTQPYAIYGPWTSNDNNQCGFTLVDRAFDLCPIVLDTPPEITLEYRHDASAGQRAGRAMTYEITLWQQGRADLVVRGGTGLQCPEGTWICLKAQTESGWTATPVARVSGSSRRPSAIIQLEESLNLDPVLVVHMSGHHGPRDIPERSAIRFLCDPASQEQSRPVAIGKQHGVHTFLWSTKYACAVSAPPAPAPPHASNVVAIAESDSEEPPSQNEDTDGEELRDQFPSHPSRRRAAVVIVLLTGLGIIVLGYLLYSTATPLRTFFTTYFRPLTFRTSETSLVRWAQEELPSLDEEEDFMVNHHSASEYIPLKPSPRHHFFHNYGSAW